MNVAHRMAADLLKRVDSIDVGWGTFNGNPEVKIYGFPNSAKEALIIDRVRVLKQQWNIEWPIVITFRAYPVRRNNALGSDLNQGYQPDAVLRSITL